MKPLGPEMSSTTETKYQTNFWVVRELMDPNVRAEELINELIVEPPLTEGQRRLLVLP